ncbi:hypothetical protein [Actinomadura sp. SCN-SB]|uniref:hypothetical protein n=1 Tax=Actinomadura sp. SCN-SB TaxID=3373092 RepID=UPI0037500D8C
MIACWAEGGGLGHLTRLRAYLRAAGLEGRAITVFTGSPFAGDPRVRTAFSRVLRPDAGVLSGLDVEELIVDAFPAGLRGDLTAASVPPGARVIHLARLLRWDAYRRVLPDDAPRFDRTYVLEDLDPGHLAYLRARSAEMAPLTLAAPPGVGPSDVPPDAWVIVHSGPEEEIAELAGYAADVAALEGADPGFVLVCPGAHRPDPLPAGLTHLDRYPVRLPPPEVFTGMVFTAAGFNAVRGLAPWRAMGRHRMLPFPRTFDDQFTRAARARHHAVARS